MTDFWITQFYLSVIGNGYIALVVLAIGLILWLVPGRSLKVICTLVALAFASIIPWQVYQDARAENERAEDFRRRQATANAVFDERCKSAGEKIYKTVTGVEGIRIVNVRPKRNATDVSDPMWAGAALANEVTGDGYIAYFLYWEYPLQGSERGYLNPRKPGAVSRGYRYVDLMRPDGSLSRRQLISPESDKLQEIPIVGETARYAVEFKDEINPEDRKHWVAGTAVMVKDTKTGELLASLVIYAFESGLGSTTGFRQPWVFAQTCPSFQGFNSARTRFFVDKVLLPYQDR